MSRHLSHSIVAVAILTAVVLTPATASAKCMPGGEDCLMVEAAQGTIGGPGLGAPIVLGGDDLWTVARRAGLGSYRPASGTISPSHAPTAAELGPRYRLELRVRLSDGDRFAVAVDVYPYVPSDLVPGGTTAWVRIPSALRFVAAFDPGFVSEVFRPEPGWYRSTALHQTLVGLGLPERSPVRSAASGAGTADGAVGEATSGEASTAGTWVLAAALLALLLGGALLGRPREARTGGRVRPS